MLKKEVKIGGHYMIQHGNALELSEIRIDCPYRNGWLATKLSTGRQIRIKSAAKLRYEVEKEEV